MKVGLITSFPGFLRMDEKKEVAASSFYQVLEDFLKEVNSQQLSAREVEKALSEGKVENIEKAMYTIENASLSLRLLTEIRNKALESYQEIMRMQV